GGLRPRALRRAARARRPRRQPAAGRAPAGNRRLAGHPRPPAPLGRRCRPGRRADVSRTGWRAFFAALPDGLTAAAFAAIWISPFVFGEAGVRTAMLVMLLEFFLVHATGFFTAFVMAPGLARGKRVAAILGLSLFYLLMIGALASS